MTGIEILIRLTFAIAAGPVIMFAVLSMWPERDLAPLHMIGATVTGFILICGVWAALFLPLVRG